MKFSKNKQINVLGYSGGYQVRAVISNRAIELKIFLERQSWLNERIFFWKKLHLCDANWIFLIFLMELVY